MFGSGITAMDSMLGMLGIGVHCGSRRCWSVIADRVGMAQQKVADDIQKINLQNEIKAMQEKGIEQVLDGDRWIWPLTVMYDMGWQKRAAGKHYNSSSGHGFLVVAYTNKVIKRVCYSHNCATCKSEWKRQKLTAAEATKDELPGEVDNTIKKTHRCPRNYNASSKLMEACGAVSMITSLYETTDSFARMLIGDDDATTRSNVRHSYKEILKANPHLKKAHIWPKTAGGNYVVDSGKLPLHVRAILEFLADPSHRGKSFGRALYKFEKERGKELKFTAIDCERLKQNFNFWQQQNQHETYEVFLSRYVAVIDHHFGDHSCCQGKSEGGWCKYKGNDELMKEAKKNNRYRDKEADIVLYTLVLKIWQHFGTELMLKQVHHLFMSQKSESLHQQITRVAPKDRHFSNTMSLSDRVALVVITDSVGYEEGISLICAELGIVLPTTVQDLKRRNSKRQYDKLYHRRLDQKNVRYSMKKEKIRKELDDRAKDAASGVTYEPSIDVAQINETNGDSPGETVLENDMALSTTSKKRGRKRRLPATPELCKDCDKMTTTHKSMRSSKCSEHWRYLQRRGTCYMWLYVTNHPLLVFYIVCTHLSIFFSTFLKCHNYSPWEARFLWDDRFRHSKMGLIEARN